MNKRNRPFDGSQAPYYTGAEPPGHCLFPIRSQQSLGQGLRTGRFVDLSVYKAIRNLIRDDKNLRQYKPKMADVLRWLLDQGLDHVTSARIQRTEIGDSSRVVTTCEFDTEPLDRVAELAKVLSCSPHDVIACAITAAYEKHLAAAVKAAQ